MLGYAAAVALTGVLLFKAAMLDAPASLAERAVALERGGVTLRDALRDLLGDPELEIGFALGPDELVDDQGRPLAPRSADRVATPVTVAGRRVGAVVHEPLTLDDAAIRSAVIAAVGLAAERARLRTEVGRQADAVDASRRRLLLTEEEERRRLAERLERGPGAALADVERLVREARPAARRRRGARGRSRPNLGSSSPVCAPSSTRSCAGSAESIEPDSSPRSSGSRSACPSRSTSSWRT